MTVSPQLIEALVQIISGGPGTGTRTTIGIYRTGPEIGSFLRACGVNYDQGVASRLPALTAALEGALRWDNSAEALSRIVEHAANPSDFDGPEHHERVVTYLNQRLIADGMVLRTFDGRMRCLPTNQSAAVTGSLAQRVTVFDFDTVRRDLDRAIDSTERDPEDAVTAACSLVESMCRSILIEMQLSLPEQKDVASLYKAVRGPLGLLSPEDNLPDEMRADVRGVLSGLANVVQHIGALRTHAGDAHGRERGYHRIDSRIARLAIHSASAVALFLLETWGRQAHRPLPIRD